MKNCIHGSSVAMDCVSTKSLVFIVIRFQCHKTEQERRCEVVLVLGLLPTQFARCILITIGSNFRHSMILPIQLNMVASGIVFAGFGFFVDEQTGVVVKKPQELGVRIGSNVEVGANTCVDRGSWRDTVIGDNVKIDNLVQVIHSFEHVAELSCWFLHLYIGTAPSIGVYKSILCFKKPSPGRFPQAPRQTAQRTFITEFESSALILNVRRTFRDAISYESIPFLLAGWPQREHWAFVFLVRACGPGGILNPRGLRGDGWEERGGRSRVCV